MANLADHLFRQERHHGAKTALIFEGRCYSYAEMADTVRRTAAGLAEEGIGRGTHVGLIVTSQPAFIFLQQAAFALGAILTPLNIFYRRSELEHAIRCCELDHLLMERDFVDRLPAQESPGMTRLTAVLVVDDAAVEPTGKIRSAGRLADRGTAIAGPEDLDDHDIGLMLNTSATTGTSKGVMLSLANIRANYDATPDWLGLGEQTVTLCALPLYNTFGLNQCINALMVTGCTMVLMRRFDAAQCLAAIERHRCTFFPAVPTMLQKLLDHPDAASRDLSSIRLIMTGAAPVPAALLKRIHAVMGRDTKVITGYGLTECTAIVSLEHIELDEAGKVVRPKSLGTCVPGTEMRILREDGGMAAPGEVGEICVRGPNVMAGYYKMPEHTDYAIVDGWMHTGDLGYFDEDGHGYIVDRKKDVIIRGGQNIYPADIEEALYHYPGVAEVAVIGEPDEVMGEVPVAYVALADAATVSTEDLIAWCKEELAYYKVPAAIRFLPELPKGPTGKILRRVLRPQPAASADSAKTP